MPITCIWKSLNISLDFPATVWHVPHPPLPKKISALFLRNVHRTMLAAREAIDRRVREDQRELEFGDGPSKHGEVDRSARGHARKYRSEEPPVNGRGVEPLQYRLPYGIVP